LYPILRNLVFSLASAVVVLSWLSAGVRGVAIHRNTIEARQGLTAGETVTGGDATFFAQEGAPGACGQVHADSDLIVAVPTALFSNSICGGQITITNTQNQQTVTAAIADKCAACDAQSLDLSEGAFQTIGSEAQGRVPISWTVVSV